MKKTFSLLIAISILLSLSSCASIASRFEKIPAPAVTYAEFPFEVVYEIDNEVVTVNDVFVCEFDGFAWNENEGKHRQWRGYVKSTGKDHLVLLEEGSLTIACKLGTAAYYMSDPSMDGAGEFTPYLYYTRTYASGGVSTSVAGLDKLLEQYGISIISWKLSKPIENHFE